MTDIDKEAISNADKAKELIFGKKKTSKKKRIGTFDRFLLGFSFILIIITAVIVFSGDKEPSSNITIVATINGENILFSELKTEYEKLPLEIQLGMAKEDLLGQMIDKVLLLQEVNKQGVQVSFKEFTSLLESIRFRFNTEEEFDNFLKEQNMTLLQFQNELRDQIKISNLLNEILVVNITNEEIEALLPELQADVTEEEGRAAIASFLALEKQRDLYELYIDELRSDSIIENYLETDGLAYSLKQSFGECLKENNVKVYGTDWCQYTEKQKNILGDDFEHVDYVICETESRESTGKCLDIDKYPTWNINNKLISGVLSIKQIEELTGCKKE